MLLIQEEFKHDPWKMLVACVLLNRTGGNQAKRVIYDLFKKYPDPGSMSSADERELMEILSPLGMQKVRSKRLIEMSRCCTGDWTSHPDRLPGVGRYAVDSWKIFVLGRTDLEVNDKELKKYLKTISMR